MSYTPHTHFYSDHTLQERTAEQYFPKLQLMPLSDIAQNQYSLPPPQSVETASFLQPLQQPMDQRIRVPGPLTKPLQLHRRLTVEFVSGQYEVQRVQYLP
ncbi:cytochrome c oxidase assembly factor 6-like protein [Platysternon megacephalum]|uniref:Cytochrome c oxidase assembly factor 6-like protein n=1 Tax=Platysternon megacephalum TaxID=55544 RepID=A0A4D9EU25_9SAUR|nr:cytochrome c oxidase assembly factor 6-like protein [Platysternon megacephalum]